MIQLVTVAAVISTYEKPAMVDTRDDAQTDLWASRLMVSREKLLEAVQSVGPSVAAVQRHLARSA